MQQEIITAIDFGSYKFSASAAIKDEDGEMRMLNTVSIKSSGIEKGLISDTDECREAIKDLLNQLEGKIKGDIEKVNIGISSRKLRLSEKTIDIELVEDTVTNEAIANILNNYRSTVELNEEECIVDEVINFYIIDGKAFTGEIDNWKCSSAQVNISLVIGLKSEIQKFYDVFENTRYILADIKANILCGKQIFLNDNSASGSVAIADIGAGKVDIAVFNRNNMPIHISSIPVGGNNISNDLAICGEFSFSEAEELKKKYSADYKSLYKDSEDSSEEIEVGNVTISKELFYEVTNARIEEILNHVNNELKKTGHLDRICSIILYGDGVSYFEGINKIANKIFSVKTKVITGVDLGIKNSENITSMALAKEVYDRSNLLGDNNIVSVNKNIEEQHQVIEKETLHYNEDENQILKKLKSLFNKIF